MALRVLCIDCEPETVAALNRDGFATVNVELGYRTGKRRFVTPPHEFDLMVCDLKKPACFDSLDWGPGRNDNFHCKLVERLSDEAYLRDGELQYKHRIIQEGQLPKIIPGTFGPDDILQAIKEGGVPFLLFLNDEWVKRVGYGFPNYFNLSWRFRRTVATQIKIDALLTDRLPELGRTVRISLPLQNAIAEGPRPRTRFLSLTSSSLVTNSVKDVFGQVISVGAGNIWLLPSFDDNVLAIARVAANLSAFRAPVTAIMAAQAVAPPAPTFHPVPSRPMEAAAAVPRLPTAVAVKADEPSIGPNNRTVFVIHGRDDRLRTGMFDFLRSLDLKPLEWSEAITLTGKASPYVGEILDAAFSNAQAVVVLLTPDDEARLRAALHGPAEPSHETNLTPQARPNVLFEAGMAMARDPDRTILVEIGDLRPFSDIGGRHTIRMDNSTQKRQALALRLQSAGCAVNLKGTDWQTDGDLSPPAFDKNAAQPSQSKKAPSNDPKSEASKPELSKFQRIVISPVSRSTSHAEYTLEKVDEVGVLVRLTNGMSVRIPQADYIESWDDATEKPTLILTRKYFQGYFPGHESAKEYFLPR